MIRLNLCYFTDAYIHAKTTITLPNTEAAAAPVNNANKKVVFKNCTLFINCVSRITNTQVDDAQDNGIVMPYV